MERSHTRIRTDDPHIDIITVSGQTFRALWGEDDHTAEDMCRSAFEYIDARGSEYRDDSVRIGLSDGSLLSIRPSHVSAIRAWPKS